MGDPEQAIFWPILSFHICSVKQEKSVSEPASAEIFFQSMFGNEKGNVTQKWNGIPFQKWIKNLIPRESSRGMIEPGKRFEIKCLVAIPMALEYSVHIGI